MTPTFESGDRGLDGGEEKSGFQSLKTRGGGDVRVRLLKNRKNGFNFPHLTVFFCILGAVVASQLGSGI